MKKKIKIAIIDYDIGNLFSVQNAFEKIEVDTIITSDIHEIKNADAIVLPGVGAFGDAMENLKKFELINPIKEFIATGKPFMGICLGMQLLFTESEEFGNHKGLDIIKGKVKRFSNEINGIKVKVPQISWNQIYRKNIDWEKTELEGITDGEYMYFVHSYYTEPENINEILTLTNYEGIEYCSSVKKDNVFAVQYHPEKSGENGIKIYENFKNEILKKL